MNGESPEQADKPKIEYDAQVVSPLVNGNAKLTIGENSFTTTALFDATEISFSDVNALDLTDYTITIMTDHGDYSFSRMGNWTQPFYDSLCDAYNKAVLRALFISGSPIITVNGDFRLIEKDMNIGSYAVIHVHEECVVALPPGGGVRRIPLCFTVGMDKGDYELTLKLITGESYTFSKLGYDTAHFADMVEKQIRSLREKALATIKEIDPALTTMQSSQISKLIPEGAAAPLGQISAIAPSFTSAIENKISQTRAAGSYNIFKELCHPAQIWVGFKKNISAASDSIDASSDLSGILGSLGGILGADVPSGDEESEPVPPDPYLFWMIAPSPDGQYAAVEFAVQHGESASTFVYRTGGDFPMFASQLNRALEAISFKREVIRLTDEELRKPENADYYMAAKHTSSLQFIRANFTGRIIHSSPESWKKNLLRLWNGDASEKAQATNRSGNIQPVSASGKEQPVAGPDKPKFCGQCGAKFQYSTKFCVECGAKISALV